MARDMPWFNNQRLNKERKVFPKNN
uniref:Uncharacterized protein n=1 Tax=Rhizophora mucronata TaxID=61149 RepID=A0A2P2NRC2_RHIMU